MFSTSKNPQISPSFYNSTSYFCLNSSEILLPTSYQDPLSCPYYTLADNSPALVPREEDHASTAAGSLDAFPVRKIKNDRHSKIFTSQGLRDRRVRLSISVARKFFDLQETLGFDKPSKTLDWLLTKSRTAINELVRRKQTTSTPPENIISSSPSDQCGKAKGKSARDSRAKARARARERTREKILGSRSIQVSEDLSPSNIPCQKTLTSVVGFQQQNLGGFSSDDLTPICINASENSWDISSIICSHRGRSATN